MLPQQIVDDYVSAIDAAIGWVAATTTATNAQQSLHLRDKLSQVALHLRFVNKPSNPTETK